WGGMRGQAGSARREKESQKEPLYRGGAVEASSDRAPSGAPRAQLPARPNQDQAFDACRLWPSAIDCAMFTARQWIAATPAKRQGQLAIHSFKNLERTGSPAI